MEEEVLLKTDIKEAYQLIKLKFESSLEESNKLWNGTIRLLITLSSTILLASIGFVDKILPDPLQPSLIRSVMVFSWVLFFISIVFCIIAELLGASFYSKRAVIFSNQLKQILFDIGKGKNSKEIKVKESDPFIEYNSLFWGITGVITFLLGIINICLSLVGRYFHINLTVFLFLNFSFLVIFGYLISGHYKNREVK